MKSRTGQVSISSNFRFPSCLFSVFFFLYVFIYFIFNLPYILVPPEVDLDATVKEKIVVHAGGVIRILAYVSGKPAPEIIWNRDDGDLPKEGAVETTSISSALVIKSCRRQHQGIYTLTAKNAGGERKKAVIVEVLGECFFYIYIS